MGDDVPDVVVLGLRHHVDVRMVEHGLEHARVAVPRHDLELVAEVAVVAVRAGRNAGRHRLVEFRRVQSPLLSGVTAEEFFVELAADSRHDHVFGCLDFIDRFRALRKPFLKFFGRQVEIVECVDGIEIDRDRHQHAVDRRQNPVLIGTPFGEFREVIEDGFGIGVEDVRAVLMNEQAAFVIAIIRVSADVRPPVDEKHALITLGRKPLRQHAASEACSNDQPIVHEAYSAAVVA